MDKETVAFLLNQVQASVDTHPVEAARLLRIVAEMTNETTASSLMIAMADDIETRPILEWNAI